MGDMPLVTFGILRLRTCWRHRVWRSSNRRKIFILVAPKKTWNGMKWCWNTGGKRGNLLKRWCSLGEIYGTCNKMGSVAKIRDVDAFASSIPFNHSHLYYNRHQKCNRISLVGTGGRGWNDIPQNHSTQPAPTAPADWHNHRGGTGRSDRWSWQKEGASGWPKRDEPL